MNPLINTLAQWKHICVISFVSLLILGSSGIQHDKEDSNEGNIFLIKPQSLALTVVVYYPENQLNGSLYLRGTGIPSLSWSQGTKLSYVGSDKFTLTLPYTSNQIGQLAELKVLIADTTWMIGANVGTLLPQQSASVSIYPYFYTDVGTYGYHYDVYSPQLKNTRDIVVYTPASYYENPYKVMQNVLIMHDGQNLFNASTSAFGCWNCQDTLDELIYQGEMEDVLVVGVDNTINRTDEYTYSYDKSDGDGGNGNTYLDFLQDTVLPLVKEWYRVNLTTTQNLGILGSSLGGLISCYAGYTRSDIYGKAGCMSSSFWWNNEDFNNIILNETQVPTDGLKIYLDSGNAGIDDDDVTQTRRVRNHIEGLGFEMNSTMFYFLDVGGQHNEYYWGKRFWVPMTDLYPITLSPTY